MCKLHGVRLIKRNKIFESMLKTKINPRFRKKQLGVIFQHKLNWSSISNYSNCISVPELNITA